MNSKHTELGKLYLGNSRKARMIKKMYNYNKVPINKRLKLEDNNILQFKIIRIKDEFVFYKVLNVRDTESKEKELKKYCYTSYFGCEYNEFNVDNVSHLFDNSYEVYCTLQYIDGTTEDHSNFSYTLDSKLNKYILSLLNPQFIDLESLATITFSFKKISE